MTPAIPRGWELVTKGPGRIDYRIRYDDPASIGKKRGWHQATHEDWEVKDTMARWKCIVIRRTARPRAGRRK